MAVGRKDSFRALELIVQQQSGHFSKNILFTKMADPPGQLPRCQDQLSPDDPPDHDLDRSVQNAVVLVFNLVEMTLGMWSFNNFPNSRRSIPSASTSKLDPG